MSELTYYVSRIKVIRKFLERQKFNKAMAAASEDDLKVVVGSSSVFENGWIPTERHFLDLINENNWSQFFSTNSISSILAEHVWEHLTDEDGKIAIQNCYKYLRIGGRLRIAVPDGFHSDKTYIDSVKPNGHGSGADDHKILYNYKTLGSVLSDVGFKINLLEYFDEDGNFHKEKWDHSDGMVHRSFHFDKRNLDGKPNYTSLIIDGIKQ